jgi:hypothetical protein
MAKKTENLAQDIIQQQKSEENGQTNINKDVIYYDDSVSMLERTAYKLMPIIKQVHEKMINLKKDLSNLEAKNNNKG